MLFQSLILVVFQKDAQRIALKTVGCSNEPIHTMVV